MRLGMLALGTGLACLPLLPELPPIWLLLALLPVALMLLPWRSYPVAFFLFGFVWACFSAQTALDDRLLPELDGRTLWLEGRVSGLPKVGDGVVRFQLEEATARAHRLPARLRLSWYDGPPVLAGERWRLAVKLKRPRGLVNPQGFDYEAWLLAQRIGATGTIKQGERLGTASGPAAWRDELRQRLLSVEAHGRSGGLAALVLGDDSGLSRADWKVLQDTGTVHLLVISGQHVALLAAVLYGLVAGLARLGLWPRLLPWLPWACGLAFAGALGYGLLAGFEVPVRRACVMVALVLLWRLRFRHLGLWWPLVLAFILVLLVEPLASPQAGFWLSFGAVAVLVWVFGGRLGAWSWWRVWWRAQWTLALGLLPLFFALGLPLSLSGPLANLVAVPWVSLLVVPLALLGTLLLPVPWLGEGLLWLAGGLLEILLQLLAWIAALLPAWLPTALPLWCWLLGSLGVLLCLAPAGVPLRALGLVMLLAFVAPPRERIAPGQAEIWQLDVGQGLAVLVRTREHALLYDAGPRFGDFDLGERVVLPSLRQLGVSRLDLMLLSHADSDHAGGAEALARVLPIDRVLSGEAIALPASLAAQPCIDGASWRWDGVRFTTWRWAGAGEGNPASCLLKVEAAGERLLLTGDIDEATETALLASGRDLRAEWLQVPHHGSRSSSSAAFLDAVAPRAALLSRGWHNPFGHPHPRVLARYRERDISLYDSAERGAVRLLLGEDEGVSSWRERPRFWREK
ncbi:MULTISPECIES: DNA internalization-related competence protein ComEC/Rec2 [unclassified Pseudomonas]|uniref:DNA internalization-related competence protein ComEC/Rec2 n=1 Tax=unclassified Pseudomonas TaxID=196821 RepID=UPI00244BC691|nr:MULTISPECIES: DNA internalization-related competence protein ComEC/Rec2 [unclassified Pseudomonas]MDG9923975.1 DNA internalization-related competence protein ComEC/Rec2 [Pseudomonas sp. GD04045]MDH0035038.1 DNA internalization-related competence protein ComEC/Rec2 [Pseudomonas sp. GD04019]